MSDNIRIFENSKELYENAAATIINLVNEFINNNDKCTFVLSGGNTPRNLYKLLLDDRYKNYVNWQKVYFFWGDERDVSPEDKDSNYKMAYDNLLSNLNIPQDNVYRIKTEFGHERAAVDYENILREYFPDVQFPSFDIVLLGLGEDGHTASLFPGSEALREKKKWVVDNYVEKLNVWRITLTYPVLNNAKNVIFLVSGKEKVDAVKSVLNDKDKLFPAVNIIPLSGNLIWYLVKNDRDPRLRGD